MESLNVHLVALLFAYLHKNTQNRVLQLYNFSNKLKSFTTKLTRIFMKTLALIIGAMLTMATSAFAQFGVSTTSDAVFTPVTPCRLFDTRTTQGGTGPITAAGTKGFYIWGQSSYAAQGGSTTNCGIDAGTETEAVAMNITIVTPNAGGFITAYPSGAVSVPNAATVNFNAGDVKGNFTIVKVQQSTIATQHLAIYSTSMLDVVGDVVGYFARPKGSNLFCSNPPEATLVVAPGELGRVGIPACLANSYGGGSSTPYCSTDGLEMVTYGASGQCAMKNMGATSATITAGRRCCGVPGRPNN
jgi:hypothetical protein